MSEMIERVARTLCVANGEDPDKPSGAFGEWWKSYENEARAAIEAMREPTDVMVGAAVSYKSAGVIDIWQTMIDFALWAK